MIGSLEYSLMALHCFTSFVLLPFKLSRYLFDGGVVRAKKHVGGF